MKKLGAILFGIVFILGLSIVTAPAQQVETVNPDGVVAEGDWSPAPVVGDLIDPAASFASAYGQSKMTVNFADPVGGPYTATAIKVKFQARSFYGESDLNVGLNVGQVSMETFTVPDVSNFQEYSYLWTNLNVPAEDLENLQVQIDVTWVEDQMDISAIQVEFVSEDTAPPEEPDPIQITIDYRPYRSSNSLNYRSRGKVHVVIFGSADLDVSQIDRESVLLAGVAPVRDRIRRVYSRTDRARDEYHDLVLTFKTQQLIKALEISREQELENGDEVVLNLTGNLKDDGNLKLTGNLKDDGAIPIEGEDTAVVFGKRDKNKKKGKSKNHWKWWR